MSFFDLLINKANHLVNQIYKKNYDPITPDQLIWQHIQDCEKQFQKNQEAIYYSKDILQDLINKRLQTILLHAKTKSPWYKRTLAKINIENFTRERLEELPTINKNIFNGKLGCNCH